MIMHHPVGILGDPGAVWLLLATSPLQLITFIEEIKQTAPTPVKEKFKH